jgi:RNA polymerase sigma-70 factor (TIGR02960 family)
MSACDRFSSLLLLSICVRGNRHGDEVQLSDEFRPGSVSAAVMNEPTLTRARRGDEEAFRDLTDPYRRELQLHCYRILGSLQDAEDLLQETLLAAWRGLEQFEERSSVRTWLYRIATNRCLNALRDSGRRPRIDVRFPSDLPEPTRIGEPTWLEPYPDELLERVADAAPGPEARYEAKESVALAFVAGLQRLPPRQRAALVLRDVLGFRASEAAAMLDMSEASVNSALQRARGTLEGRFPAGLAGAPAAGSALERDLVARFAEAFVNDDIDAVVELMTEDALVTMPPEPLEYQGHEAIHRFFLDRVHARGGRGIRFVPTRANGQPALGHYIEDPHAPVLRCYGLIVLTLEGDRISGLTRFRDTAILPQFGLPRTLPA